jgi:hypothetical protein
LSSCTVNCLVTVKQPLPRPKATFYIYHHHHQHHTHPFALHILIILYISHNIYTHIHFLSYSSLAVAAGVVTITHLITPNPHLFWPRSFR